MSSPNAFRRTLPWVAGLVLAILVAASASAAERVAVGTKAPAFALAPAGGGADAATLELAALQGKKRALLVFFRGSW